MVLLVGRPTTPTTPDLRRGGPPPWPRWRTAPPQSVVAAQLNAPVSFVDRTPRGGAKILLSYRPICIAVYAKVPRWWEVTHFYPLAGGTFIQNITEPTPLCLLDQRCPRPRVKQHPNKTMTRMVIVHSALLYCSFLLIGIPPARPPAGPDVIISPARPPPPRDDARCRRWLPRCDCSPHRMGWVCFH